MANPVRNAVLLSACTIGAGAALMYFFDPDRGNRRRAQVRDKAQSLAKDSNLWVRKAGRDLGNRARGFAAETRSRFWRQAPSDEVLTERVRSKLGRYTSHPAAIDVSVKDGIVTLRGDMLQSEVRDVVSCVYSMRDVADVHNQLTTHADSAGVPALRGDGSRQTHAMRPRRSPAARLILGATAGALAVYGVTSHRRLGRTLGALGLGLLTTQFSTRARRLGSFVSAAKDRAALAL